MFQIEIGKYRSSVWEGRHFTWLDFYVNWISTGRHQNAIKQNICSFCIWIYIKFHITRIKMNNKTDNLPPRGGSDLPVLGIDSGLFNYIHKPALICLCSAGAVLMTSFRRKNVRKFFSWNKSERFVIYMAIWDALFNISHSVDHIQVLMTKNHVFLIELCECYSFMMYEFVSAQILMVDVTAFNGFMLMYCRININFGRYDWKLSLYMCPL